MRGIGARMFPGPPHGGFDRADPAGRPVRVRPSPQPAVSPRPPEPVDIAVPEYREPSSPRSPRRCGDRTPGIGERRASLHGLGRSFASMAIMRVSAMSVPNAASISRTHVGLVTLISVR